MNCKKRKAAAGAAFIYVLGMGFVCGMLRAAQVTRRTLYGGVPVMAQVTAESGSAPYRIALGGGEWELTLDPAHPEPAALAEKLPPCLLKWLLRLDVLSQRAAGQTAEYISELRD